MRTSEKLFKSQLSLTDIKRALNQCMGKAEVNPMQYDPMDIPADFGVVAIFQPLLGRARRVEIEVSEADQGTLVSLTATGDGVGGTLWYGMRSVSFGASVEWREKMVSALRSMDQSLVEIPE